MNAKLLLPFTGTAATVLAAALAANMVACGGLDEDTRLMLATQQPQAAARAAPPPGLMDDNGSLRAPLPEAVPADPGAHTRSGRYALREQALALDLERRGDVVWLDITCCGSDAADSALGIVQGLRTSAEVSPDAPVLVKGRDQRLAAFVVNRLEEEGERRVFLVTR